MPILDVVAPISVVQLVRGFSYEVRLIPCPSCHPVEIPLVNVSLICAVAHNVASAHRVVIKVFILKVYRVPEGGRRLPGKPDDSIQRIEGDIFFLETGTINREAFRRRGKLSSTKLIYNMKNQSK